MAGNVLILLGFALMFVALALKAIVVVPTFHYGMVRQFGKLTGKKLNPGLRFVFPFIEDVLLESVGKQPLTSDMKLMPVSIAVITEDKLEITVEGSVQWRIDMKVRDKRTGLPAFLNIGSDALQRGIADAIKSEIGVIASVSKGEDFIGRRQAIQDLIQQVLRRQTPAHQRPEAFNADGESVLPEHRLEKFYQHPAVAAMIKTDLKREHAQTADRSTIEKRYGIDIVTFELTHVGFTEETMKALESQQQTVAKMKAAEEQFAKKMAVYQRLREAGMSHQEAINEASVTVGQAEKKIFSVEGLRNLFGGGNP